MVTTVDKIIIDYFNNLFDANGVGNLILCTISFVLTILLVGLVGFEREYQGHPAGLRTHTLVGIGSSVIMFVSIYAIGYENRDTMRLAAQVVSGIGFLGAGTIIQTGTDIKGLTTATTLWISMAIGLACGAGSFLVALLGSIFTLIALVCLKPLEKFASKRNPVVMIVVPTDTPIMKDIVDISRRYGLKARTFDTQVIDSLEGPVIRIVINFEKSKYENVEAFVHDIDTTIHPSIVKIC